MNRLMMKALALGIASAVVNVMPAWTCSLLKCASFALPS
jgi:hypothetical protein